VIITPFQTFQKQLSINEMYHLDLRCIFMSDLDIAISIETHTLDTIFQISIRIHCDQTAMLNA